MCKVEFVGNLTGTNGLPTAGRQYRVTYSSAGMDRVFTVTTSSETLLQLEKQYGWSADKIAKFVNRTICAHVQVQLSVIQISEDVPLEVEEYVFTKAAAEEVAN